MHKWKNGAGRLLRRYRIHKIGEILLFHNVLPDRCAADVLRPAVRDEKVGTMHIWQDIRRTIISKEDVTLVLERVRVGLVFAHHFQKPNVQPQNLSGKIRTAAKFHRLEWGRLHLSI